MSSWWCTTWSSRYKISSWLSVSITLELVVMLMILLALLNDFTNDIWHNFLQWVDIATLFIFIEIAMPRTGYLISQSFSAWAYCKELNDEVIMIRIEILKTQKKQSMLISNRMFKPKYLEIRIRWERTCIYLTLEMITIYWTYVHPGNYLLLFLWSCHQQVDQEKSLLIGWFSRNISLFLCFVSFLPGWLMVLN